MRRSAATARSRAVVERMQTREQLYDALDYHRYEREADERLKKSRNGLV
jgi:2-methylisocitrate lyase-like PEP mutase family enzyme